MSKVATRYARALVTATPVKDLAALTAELTAVAEATSEGGVQAFFTRPDIAAADKEKLLTDLTNKLSTPIVNLLKILIQNSRFSELTAIAAAFKQIADAASGQLTATIETPVKLSGKTAEQITATLKKLSGKDVSLAEVLNKDLLGGLKIRFGDEVIDLSLTGRLAKLQQSLV